MLRVAGIPHAQPGGLPPEQVRPATDALVRAASLPPAGGRFTGGPAAGVIAVGSLLAAGRKPPNRPRRPRRLTLRWIAAAVALAGATCAAGSARLRVGRRVLRLGDEIEAAGIALAAAVLRSDPFIGRPGPMRPVVP